MNTNSNSKGIRHAPGILCLIAGIPKIGGCAAARDNGKIVTLSYLLKPGMTAKCACGSLGAIQRRLAALFGPFWQVTGTGLYCERIGSTNTTAAIPQRYLIPLGDQSVLSTDELIATLEDRIKQALILRGNVEVIAIRTDWKDYN